MRRDLIRCAGLVLVAATFLGDPPARAAGLLVTDGGLGGVLEVREHDVKVTLNNGV